MISEHPVIRFRYRGGHRGAFNRKADYIAGLPRLQLGNVLGQTVKRLHIRAGNFRESEMRRFTILTPACDGNGSKDHFFQSRWDGSGATGIPTGNPGSFHDLGSTSERFEEVGNK
jgi:hypothetical protein